MSEGNGDRRSGTDRRQSDTSSNRVAARRAQARRWLRPGIGIKRWLLVVFLGELLLALACAVVLRIAVPRPARAGGPSNGLIDVLIAWQFLPPELRAAAAASWPAWRSSATGSWRLLRVLIEPYQAREEPLVEMLYQRRRPRARPATSWRSAAAPACPCCCAA